MPRGAADGGRQVPNAGAVCTCWPCVGPHFTHSSHSSFFQFLLPRDALDFLAKLSRKYSGRVTQLLERRREQQARFDAGEKPVFLPETKKVRMLLV